MTPGLERRLLQVSVALAGLVPVSAGGWGAWHGLGAGGFGGETHGHYLSGLLLGIGLIFWWTIPTIERRGTVVRTLTGVVLVGGLARLDDALRTGFGPTVVFPLVMELGVTPLLALWRERVGRLYPLSD
ncbi:MAG: DUF4345 domain-containing protein [Phenylobacterium sp.]|nr:MAG: DUF4345 domain-containing protein [Phenylobacterium sp.]